MVSGVALTMVLVMKRKRERSARTFPSAAVLSNANLWLVMAPTTSTSVRIERSSFIVLTH